MERSRLEWPDTTSRFRNPARSVAWLPALLLWGCWGSTAAEDPASAATTDNGLQTDDVSFDVTLLGTGSATIHATVYENSAGTPGGVNVLAVHGWCETGFGWKPLAKAIFADSGLRHAIKRIIAIDRVGHGDSSFPADLPNGMKFGQLQIDDNANVLVQSIDALRKLGLSPRAVLAHDLGGLEVQAAQEALLASGSSLAAHGVTSAVLLAPVPALDLSWSPAFTASAGGFSSLTERIVTDPFLGQYLPLPQPSAATSRFEYTTTRGELVPDAPTTAEALEANYIGPEPFLVSLQVVQALPRPPVSAGVLAASHGTLTSILSFSEDIVVPAADVKELYAYLTADVGGKLYRPIVADDAVHNMFVSNPAALIDALRALPW
jgi:pimeloyl-ACP methyl ester carboxylesterase